MKHVRDASRLRRFAWPVAGAAAVLVLLITATTVVMVRSGSAGAWPSRAHGPTPGGPSASGGPAGADPAASASPSASVPGSASASSGKPPSASANVGGGRAPAKFTTSAAGAALPSGAQCAAWVRTKSYAENKGVNKTANQRTGHSIGSTFFGDARANAKIAPRVDGNFTGTTREILRWAACKWGIDEDMVYAQAAVESWWQQTTLGDWGTDSSRCAPGRGLGVDGKAGQCPESFGILQNRYPYEQAAWPGIGNSTAMNADLAYGIWRNCYEGYEGWLNTVERGRDYAPGDAWGCFGRWFSGRWHTTAGEQYVTKVRGYLDQRIWETPNFQQP